MGARSLKCLAILVALLHLSSAQIDVRHEARFCVMNDEEMQKCEALQEAIETITEGGYTRPPDLEGDYEDLPEVLCHRAVDVFECMELIAENDMDLMQLDTGVAYTAGEYYNMMPLVAEKYERGGEDTGIKQYAVAVVRKDHRDIDLENLAGKKSCHTGVGRAAGWVYPVSYLIEHEWMPITECNVPVKSAAEYFGDMCAPDGLARYYNPFGTNPVSICQNCKGYGDTFCNQHDPYAGYSGAFECMSSEEGEVAWVRNYTVYQATKNASSSLSPDDFELLCTDNRRMSVDRAEECNWGLISSHVVMTSAIRDIEVRNEYKKLLLLMSADFGTDGINYNLFQLFESHLWGDGKNANLMFTDQTLSLQDVAEADTYYKWAGDEYRDKLLMLNACPMSQARWCVISPKEMEKCEDMIMAFAARNLKPDLNCIFGTSVRDCMDKIRMGDADMMAVDAADTYVAGKYYQLVPIAAEDYSGYDSSTYYAVAVARKIDSHLTIFNLKNRRSCHSAVMSAAGWILPIDKMIETGQIVVEDGNTYFSVGQFFTKSCVPGALHEAYNTKGSNPINLCEACAAGGHERCVRNDEELYYGNSGAFRCLVEFGGEVAFVRHTTARENTDGRNRAEWSRNRRSDDYELLCNDGTRADIDSWEQCNMGEVPSDAILTADFKTEMERDIYWTLLNYAQQFYGSDSNPDFQMFTSTLNHKDLMFQDATVRLVHVPPEDQNYEDYLGSNFMRAMERMENMDDITSAATCHRVVDFVVISALAMYILLRR